MTTSSPASPITPSDRGREALAGLVARYQTQGPNVLRPHKDRFRKLRSDRDPELRRVAAWALERTADLVAAPALIDALTDPDENVIALARLSLQLISRKNRWARPAVPLDPRAAAGGRPEVERLVRGEPTFHRREPGE